MKYLFKKYWILILLALIINLPIFYLGVSKTDKSIILTGDTFMVDGLVSIDNEIEVNGSYSSIFVISMDHATKLQAMITSIDEKAFVYDMTDDYLHFSNIELSMMGSIQFQSAIDTSIIQAYLEAKKYDNSINIEYTNKSLCISYYEDGSPFRIGDEIIAINNISIETDFEMFRNAFNNRKANDIIKVLRNETEVEIVLDENNINSFGGYRYYNINYDTLFPQLTINYQSLGGPSGGLLQTLHIFDKITTEDFAKGNKIAGTGTIEHDGSVGPIGGIEQKIYTAYADNVDIFFCPEENYQDALKAYNTLENKERMALVMVRTLEDAINYLKQCKNSA
jgi:PDZ domain-containing protein